MNLAEPTAASRGGAGPRSALQTRIIAAALDLFGTHGVSGTSLQMIADASGVTKSSIYYQFKTKDEIVLAAAEFDLMSLESALDVAEAVDSAHAREVLLAHVIKLSVERRHVTSALQRDPVMIRFLAEHEPFARLMDRLYTVLTGGDAEARVGAVMFTAMISGGLMHPLVADLDDDTLRVKLLSLTRRLFDLTD